MCTSGVTRGEGGHLLLGAAFWGPQIEIGMLRNNYEISADAINNNLQNFEWRRLLPVAKSHQDHQGPQSEQLRTFSDVLRWSFSLQH